MIFYRIHYLSQLKSLAFARGEGVSTTCNRANKVNARDWQDLDFLEGDQRKCAFAVHSPNKDWIFPQRFMSYNIQRRWASIKQTIFTIFPFPFKFAKMKLCILVMSKECLLFLHKPARKPRRCLVELKSRSLTDFLIFLLQVSIIHFQILFNSSYWLSSDWFAQANANSAINQSAHSDWFAQANANSAINQSAHM